MVAIRCSCLGHWLVLLIRLEEFNNPVIKYLAYPSQGIQENGPLGQNYKKKTIFRRRNCGNHVSAFNRSEEM